MKIVIVYSSIHNGNTKKLVEGIKQNLDVECIDAKTVTDKQLANYDVIGLATGIYNGKCHEKIRKLIDESKQLTSGKKAFLIVTSGSNGKKYGEEEKEKLEDKGCKVLGIYKCKGFDTYGIFKLVGGIAKGHPNHEDIKQASEFIAQLF